MGITINEVRQELIEGIAETMAELLEPTHDFTGKRTAGLEYSIGVLQRLTYNLPSFFDADAAKETLERAFELWEEQHTKYDLYPKLEEAKKYALEEIQIFVRR